jgi:hypothetical protein
VATQCLGGAPTTADLPLPTVTPGLVLDALREVGLPSLAAKTQPAEKTLINFDTIFYTEPQPFARTITLLGQAVAIEAIPTGYTWHFGDGSTLATSTPGSPYPSKEIIYRYLDAGTTVATSVDVTYTARFAVGGAAWQDIADTVTIAGPTTDLRIAEASAVLSGEWGS